MGREDRLFKQMFEEFFEDLLSLVVPELAPRLDARKAEFVRGELFADAPETKRREVDLLAKVPTDQGENELILVHVEVEGQARNSMGQRLWQYAMLIRSRHELPLIPMVVYLRGGPSGVRKETHREMVLGEEMVSFHYFSFGLSGSSVEKHLNRPEPLAWALSTLMRKKRLEPPKHRLEIFRRLADAKLDWKRKYLLASCVEYYLELDAKEREEYRDMLEQRDNEEARSLENHWLTRMERAAERKGVRKGERQGMQQVLLRLLEQRFGTVPDSVRHRVKALDSTRKLERLADQVLTASSLDDLGLS